jgi:hypothetical protein
MYPVSGDLAFVWPSHSPRPADGFFFLHCDLCDLICFALVLVREGRPERPCHEQLGGLRGPHSWHPHKGRHPRQSFKYLRVSNVPPLVGLSDRPVVRTAVRIQAECSYADKVLVRKVQNLHYAK